ncbi:hypothetical protein MKX03_007248, partial [Papaver bracteatum]
MEKYFKKKDKFADASSNSPPSKRHCTRDGNASSSQPTETNASVSEESDISVQVPQSDPSKSSGSSSTLLSEVELENLISTGIMETNHRVSPKCQKSSSNGISSEGT